MTSKARNKIYILDTSAILSGKFVNINDGEIITSDAISEELKPGGRDYRNFLFLKEKGLLLYTPTGESIKKIKIFSKKTGDIDRLSKMDFEILALALDNKNKDNNEVIILTDDYSIQNVANFLNIKYENIVQPKIEGRYQWISRCRGCGKKFKDNINICPICGSEIKKIIFKKKKLNFN